MGGLAADAGIQIRNVSTTSTALRRASRDRDTLLDQLMSDTYRSATLVRDYVLERDDAGAMRQKTELAAVRSRMEQELQRFEGMTPTPEEAALRILQQHMEVYWNTLAPALGWSGAARRQQGDELLFSVIVPKRDELVQLVRQISVLDE